MRFFYEIDKKALETMEGRSRMHPQEGRYLMNGNGMPFWRDEDYEKGKRDETPYWVRERPLGVSKPNGMKNKMGGTLQ